MNSRPLVSTIIIFLNAEQFIEEAIESVFAQTYENWELLLVDDGSTDSSTEIALQYVKRYAHKVGFFEHKGHQNRGMSASRNVGIRQAKGDYIAFLDADDVWLPQKLESQVALLESWPQAALIYGPTQLWRSWAGSFQRIQRDSVQELGVQLDTLFEPPTLFTHFLRHPTATPCTCSLLFRREVIERTGGFEEAFTGLYEDQAFCAKVALEAPVFVSSLSLFKYRLHPDSTCSVAKRSGFQHAARRTFLEMFEDYISKKQIKDREVWKVLNQELRPHRYPVVYRLLRIIARAVKALPPQLGEQIERIIPQRARPFVRRVSKQF